MDLPPDMARDVGNEMAKAAPPITLAAMTLNEWLVIASLAYVALQAAYLLRKWFREEQRRGAGRRAPDA